MAPEKEKKKYPKFPVPRLTRTLSPWINLLIQSGSPIEQMEEPRLSKEVVNSCPALQNARVVSSSLHLCFSRPGS